MGLNASKNTGKRQRGAVAQRVLIIEIIGATFRRWGCERNFRMVVEDGSKRLKGGIRKPGKSFAVTAEARLLLASLDHLSGK